MDQSLKSYTSPSASDAALLPVDRRIRAQQRSTGSAGQRSSGLAAQWISWSYIASHDVAAGGGQQPTRARHDPSSQTCKSGSPDYRASIICHSTTTFETRGRPHAHIVFIGNAEIEERRKARRFLTTASRSIPSTIRTAWRASMRAAGSACGRLMLAALRRHAAANGRRCKSARSCGVSKAALVRCETFCIGVSVVQRVVSGGR